MCVPNGNYMTPLPAAIRAGHLGGCGSAGVLPKVTSRPILRILLKEDSEKLQEKGRVFF